MLGVKIGFLNKFFAKKLDKNQCTAWVYFDGATGAIVNSHNIASVLRNVAGEYTVTFSAIMDNANYDSIANGVRSVGATTASYESQTHTELVGSFDIRTVDSTGASADHYRVKAIVFGGK